MEREFTIEREGKTVTLTQEERTDCVFFVMRDNIEKAVSLVEEETGEMLTPEAREAFVSEMLEKAGEAFYEGTIQSVRARLSDF